MISWLYLQTSTNFSLNTVAYLQTVVCAFRPNALVFSWILVLDASSDYIYINNN